MQIATYYDHRDSVTSCDQHGVIQGDCVTVLKTLAGESVDFVLTDPPYLFRYKDRSGRTVANDHPCNVLDAFKDVARLLKTNSCVSRSTDGTMRTPSSARGNLQV